MELFRLQRCNVLGRPSGLNQSDLVPTPASPPGLPAVIIRPGLHREPTSDTGQSHADDLTPEEPALLSRHDWTFMVKSGPVTSRSVKISSYDRMKREQSHPVYQQAKNKSFDVETRSMYQLASPGL